MFNLHNRLLLSLIVGITFFLSLSVEAQVDPRKDYRIEDEIMLHVPAEKVEELWTFLQERFSGEVELAGRRYSTRSAVEDFTDQYFDTVDLRLLKTWSGLRYRQRIFEDGGRRELVQLKLTPEYLTDPDSTARKEFKYRVSRAREIRGPEDQHPLLRLLRERDRTALAKVLSRFNINTSALRPFILLRQERRRIYFDDVKKNEQVFTLTIDRTTGGQYWFSASFDQVELEIGERIFTEAGPKKRERLLELQGAIYEIIVGKYPEIIQDQRPKVMVVYDLITENNRLAWFILSFGLEITIVIVLVLLGSLVLLLVYLLKKCWR